MPGDYPVPADAVETVVEIKKSRFIAHAMPVSDREGVMARLAHLKQRYPDARHYCWAYVFGDPAGSCDAAMNDDGEPAGTAGKPILNVLLHKGVGDILVVVVRYFGGIKLGAGGLTRAYSSAAEAVMSLLPLRLNEATVEAVLHFDYSREQALRHWATSHGIAAGHASYAEQVTMTLRVPKRLTGELREFCRIHSVTLTLPEAGEASVLPPSG